MSKNSAIILGVVIVLIVIGAIIFARRNTSPTTLTPANQIQNTVPQSDNSQNPTAGDQSQVSQQPTPAPSANATATSSAASRNGSGQVVVTYTDSGFSPQTVTIKAGETVIFKNNASDAFWPASNPHPLHTDYPGFDALQSIPPGNTYSFQFTKVGTWGYHNHLNPQEHGTIIVQ